LPVFKYHDAVTILMRRIDVYRLKRLIQAYAVAGVESYLTPEFNEFLQSLTGVIIKQGKGYHAFDFANVYAIVTVKPGKYKDFKDVKEDDILACIITIGGGDLTIFTKREEKL